MKVLLALGSVLLLVGCAAMNDAGAARPGVVQEEGQDGRIGAIGGETPFGAAPHTQTAENGQVGHDAEGKWDARHMREAMMVVPKKKPAADEQ